MLVFPPSCESQQELPRFRLGKWPGWAVESALLSTCCVPDALDTEAAERIRVVLLARNLKPVVQESRNSDIYSDVR